MMIKFIALSLLLLSFIRHCFSSDIDYSALISIEEAPMVSTLESVGFLWETDLLEKFSSFSLYLAIPTISGELSKKIETQAIQELKKFGEVISRQFSVQDLMEDKPFLHSPSLIYMIKSIQDVNGKGLPLIQASLTLEASLTVERNKRFGQGILWGKECFVEGGIGSDLERAFSQTFSLLLKEFERDYLKANDVSFFKPTFYVLE